VFVYMWLPFMILVLVLIFRPRGLMGAREG
jgi:branched-subunit amino acid ABC-type transport system permease component